MIMSVFSFMYPNALDCHNVFLCHLHYPPPFFPPLPPPPSIFSLWVLVSEPEPHSTIQADLKLWLILAPNNGAFPASACWDYGHELPAIPVSKPTFWYHTKISDTQIWQKQRPFGLPLSMRPLRDKVKVTPEEACSVLKWGRLVELRWTEDHNHDPQLANYTRGPRGSVHAQLWIDRSAATNAVDGRTARRWGPVVY